MSDVLLATPCTTAWAMMGVHQRDGTPETVFNWERLQCCSDSASTERDVQFRGILFCPLFSHSCPREALCAPVVALRFQAASFGRVHCAQLNYDDLPTTYPTMSHLRYRSEALFQTCPASWLFFCRVQKVGYGLKIHAHTS